MARSNAKVALLLREYASILAINKVERFKIKASQRAADIELDHPQLHAAHKLVATILRFVKGR